MLESCARVCELCAAECSRHEHEHCKLCADMCRECATDCRAALPTVQ
ncbi:four-helix bundle copper-binding protein [Sphingobium sp. MP9-4]|nr:four-helix bundle copper-binding protein [Sphingobium sp. MP9-4]